MTEPELTRRRLIELGLALPPLALVLDKGGSLLESGMAGTRLTLTGYVLSTRCKAIPRALLDFWHADASGVYDNDGFRLRGHQFTDAKGLPCTASRARSR